MPAVEHSPLESITDFTEADLQERELTYHNFVLGTRYVTITVLILIWVLYAITSYL